MKEPEYPMVVTVPTLGQGPLEATVIQIAEPGSHLRRGETLATLEFDKATNVLPAGVDCIVVEVCAEPGQVVEVGSPLCVIQRGESAGGATFALSEHRPAMRFSVREMALDDRAEVLKIWKAHQLSRVSDCDLDQITPTSLTDAIMSHPRPFGAWILLRDGHIAGWAALQPCRNNPLTRSLAGEITVYVADPNAENTGASMLARHVVRHARDNGMEFIIGYTNASNDRARELLRMCRFNMAGIMSAIGTEVWLRRLNL